MADRLYTRAAGIQVFYSMVGAFFGLIGGTVAMAPLDSGAAMVIGAGFGGMFGAVFCFLLARERAFALRLQAQTIMVQVQIERNGRAFSQAASA